MSLLKLKRSEGYRLCKLMNERCACEERNQRPCQSLIMYLRAGKGDADAAFDIARDRQKHRAEFDAATEGVTPDATTR